MQGFSVDYRNPGHWDIYGRNERLFRIRGDIGNVITYDERKGPYYEPPRQFKTVAAAMSFITDILMFERLASDGDTLFDADGNQLMAIAKD